MLAVLALLLGVVALSLVLKWRRDLRALSERTDQLERMFEQGARPGAESARPDTLERLLERKAHALEENVRSAAEADESAEAGLIPEEAMETAPAEPPAVPAPPIPPPSAPADRPAAAKGLDWSRLEQVAGRQWMTWIGGLAIFLAAGFFIKYAIDREWLGPTTRVVLGVIAGSGIWGLGLHFLRKQMVALGEGLIGAGMAILYLSLYASYSFYGLVPQPVAFLAMVIVTVAGLTAAVRHDALPLAFIAMLGGLLTPVLLSTGEDARDVLFSYLLLLDLGALAVALFRRWRALDVLVFAGTVLLYAAWFDKFYDRLYLAPALLWLAVFYTLFMVLPFTYHFTRATPIVVERFVIALANAAFGVFFAYRMLGRDHEHSLGFICLGMAVCYAAFARLARRRIPSDERALFGFTALAVLLLTLSVPLHFGLNGVTLVWAAEGPALLYLGYRYEYRKLRTGAFGILLLALIRVLFVHLPLQEGSFTMIFNRSFATVASVPVAAAVFAFIHHRWQRAATDEDLKLRLVCGIGAGLLALALLHLELDQWFRVTDRVLAGRCAVCVLWAAGALGLVAAGLRLRSLPYCRAAIAALLVSGVLAIRLYADPVRVARLMVLNLRFGAVLGAILAASAMAYMLKRASEPEDDAHARLSTFLGWVVLVALLLLLSAEPYSYWKDKVADPARARWLALMSVSVVWAVYASALLAAGFWRRSVRLRLAALGLFAATALKLVLVDIAGVAQMYRVVAFLVLGVLMVGGAYLYHRIERQLDAARSEREEPN